MKCDTCNRQVKKEVLVCIRCGAQCCQKCSVIINDLVCCVMCVTFDEAAKLEAATA